MIYDVKSKFDANKKTVDDLILWSSPTIDDIDTINTYNSLIRQENIQEASDVINNSDIHTFNLSLAIKLINQISALQNHYINKYYDTDGKTWRSDCQLVHQTDNTNELMSYNKLWLATNTKSYIDDTVFYDFVSEHKNDKNKQWKNGKFNGYVIEEGKPKQKIDTSKSGYFYWSEVVPFDFLKDGGSLSCSLSIPVDNLYEYTLSGTVYSNILNEYKDKNIPNGERLVGLSGFSFTDNSYTWEFNIDNVYEELEDSETTLSSPNLIYFVFEIEHNKYDASTKKWVHDNDYTLKQLNNDLDYDKAYITIINS